MELTRGTLLGGRVPYRQPAQGYRTGIEPVLMAASIPALPGQHVLEAGTGAGAGLLCLAARCPAVLGTGVEIDADLAAVARANAAEAGYRVTIAAGDIEHYAPGPCFHHAMANPPWHDPEGTRSADARRDRAKCAAPGLLARWTAALAACLQPGGTLTLALPACAAAEAFAALAEAGLGAASLFPLWPGQGREARLALLRATKASRAPARILPGLTLHAGDGYTEAARAILWDAAPLPIG